MKKMSVGKGVYQYVMKNRHGIFYFFLCCIIKFNQKKKLCFKTYWKRRLCFFLVAKGDCVSKK